MKKKKATGRDVDEEFEFGACTIVNGVVFNGREEKRGNLRTNLNKGLLFGSDINTNCHCHGQRHDSDMTTAFAHFKSNCRCHG